jgi:transcriptional regulator with XRE-family HTH domain
MAAKDPMLVELGSFLRKTREERGWSQENLAFECGLHRTYVGALERGEYNATILTLRRVTNALDVTLVEAIGSITDRKSKKR